MGKLEVTAQRLIDTAKALVADDKTSSQWMKAIPPVTDALRSWASRRPPVRAAPTGGSMLVTTAGLGESISGAILYDETMSQKTSDGTPLVNVLTEADIIIGIKVDTGAKEMAGHHGETITEGLDGLRARLKKYVRMGARFAKWRAVICLGENLPSRSGLEANAHALARYAALCQEAGLVPIVEPEVLMEGGHTLEGCLTSTEEALRNAFVQLNGQRVLLAGQR